MSFPPKKWTLLMAFLWGGYGLLSPPAQASIIYTPAELALQWINAGPSVPFDIEGDGVVDFNLERSSGFHLDLLTNIAVFGYKLNGNIPGIRTMQVLGSTNGETIGPVTAAQSLLGLEWVADADFNGFTAVTMAGGIPSNIRSFGGDFFLRRRHMGFRLERAPGEYQYGWFEVSNWIAHPWMIFVHGWAYESDINTPIIAGAIPEPTCVSVLVLSALSVLRRRRPTPCRW